MSQTVITRMPTINDVAETAGVSNKTVSNVLNGRHNVRDETKKRVLDAVKELGYQPNLVGRQLRYGRSNTIMLAVPELTVPYFAALAHAALASAAHLGYTMIITETQGKAENEIKALQGLRSSFVDGAIVSTLALSGHEAWMKHSDLPVVLLGERTEDSSIPHVIIDNRQSAIDATTHLIQQGCKHIAFLGASRKEQYGTGWMRMLGYRDALELNRYEFDERYVIPTGNYDRENGRAAVQALIDSGLPFDGLVCGNDMVAIGAMKQLHDMGFDVPRDVLVIGWDGSLEGEYYNPSLTTIAMDLPKLANQAVISVIAMIENHGSIASSMMVDYKLIVRESTMRVV